MPRRKATAGLVVTERDFDRLQKLAEAPSFRGNGSRALQPLHEELSRGARVPAEKVPSDVVTMRSQVRVRDVKTGQVDTYTVVYPHETDAEDGRISVLAPLGMALLGARVGATVEFNTPAGPRRVEIEKLLYQPEAAGDLDL